MKGCYRCQIGKTSVILASVGIALFTAGLVLNIIRLFSFSELNIFNQINCILILAVCALVIVELVLFLTSARYEIRPGVLALKLGIFSLKIDLKEISEVVYKEKSKLLFVLYGEKLMVVRIAPVLFNDFVDDLKSAGGEFQYSIDYQDLENV